MMRTGPGLPRLAQGLMLADVADRYSARLLPTALSWFEEERKSCFVERSTQGSSVQSRGETGQPWAVFLAPLEH